MDTHADTCIWFSGLLTFMAFYIVLNVIYYFIELWPYDNNNNDESDILVFNEDYTEVFIISFYYDDDEHSV